MDEALRQVKEGKTAILWFWGGRGLGKSRLLTEARLRAQLLGMEAVSIRFLAAAATDSPLLKALASLSGRRGQPPEWLGALSAEHGGSSAERSQRAARAYFETAGSNLVLLLDDF